VNVSPKDERAVGQPTYGYGSYPRRHIIPLGERHLRSAIREFVEHYHAERHHQGLGNVIPFPSHPATPLDGRICRRERLGGLLNFYERKAA
jgi:putative transposase